MCIIGLIKKRRLEWFSHVFRHEKKECVRRLSKISTLGKAQVVKPKAEMEGYHQKIPPILWPYRREYSVQRLRGCLIKLGLRETPTTQTGPSGDRRV